MVKLCLVLLRGALRPPQGLHAHHTTEPSTEGKGKAAVRGERAGPVSPGGGPLACPRAAPPPPGWPGPWTSPPALRPAPARAHRAHAHPFLELPSPPSSPQLVAFRRAHARRSSASSLLPPLRPLGATARTPGWSPRASPWSSRPLPRCRPIRSGEGRGALGTCSRLPCGPTANACGPAKLQFRHG